MRIIIGLILLSVLVLLHELGHFFAARIFRVKVDAFSIGMGLPLLHKEIGGTDWRISLFPIGGYCAMKGEGDADFFSADADSFYGIKPIFRAIIGFAGPAANFLAAVIALSFVFLIPHSYYSPEPFVSPVAGFSAQSSGILKGDKILSINGEKVEFFSDIPQILSKIPSETAKIEIERENKNLELSVKVGGDGKIGITNIEMTTEPLPIHKAFLSGAKSALEFLSLYIKGICSLFSSNVKLTEALSGPARITSELGGTALLGIVPALNFCAFISIALFVMNLLPLPVLDGFLILVSIAEAIFKKRIRGKAREIAQYAGIALLVTLFVFATANDIFYFLGSK